MPTLITAAVRTPARIVGVANGSSIRQRTASGGSPSVSADSRRGRGIPPQAGVRVSHDRQQAVQKQRGDRRRGPRSFPNEPHHDRDHEQQERQRGDRLQDAGDGENHSARSRSTGGDHPKRDADQHRRQQRRDDQQQVLAESSPATPKPECRRTSGYRSPARTARNSAATAPSPRLPSCTAAFIRDGLRKCGPRAGGVLDHGRVRAARSAR